MPDTMIRSSSSRSGWIILVFSLLLHAVYGSNSTCGALITYNQYTKIFQSAPSCLQQGCGAGNLTSMSSTCTSNSVCYPIWNILHDEYQQDWCSTCHEEDRACRIPGWPILNSTAACDMSPDTWLFKNEGCCTNGGNEMASLAAWIQTLCNGTWREQFTYYDGMALLDWEQYILPDNHTVASTNSTQAHCTSNKARYLGILGMENVVVVLVIIAYFFLTLWFSREDARNKRWVRGVKGILKPLKWVTLPFISAFKFVFRIKGSSGSTWPVIKTILLAILFAGIQLFFNFASAYVVKNAPGYEHVNVHLLAMLFCTRPRLGWIVCFLSSIPSTWVERYFNTQQSDVLSKGMMSIARVGISAAMGEVIMQLLGSFYMGKTVHVGVIRGLYKHNHLYPYWKGHQARDMYNGAILWAIALPAVVAVWVAVIVLLGLVMIFFGAIVAGWKEIKKVAKKQKSKIKKDSSSPEAKFFIPQTPTVHISEPPAHDSGHQTRPYDPDPNHATSEPSSVSLLEDDDGATHAIENAEDVYIPQYAPRMATVPRFSLSSPLQSHPINNNETNALEDPFVDPHPTQPVQDLARTDITAQNNTQTDQEQDITDPFPPQLRPGHRDSITHRPYSDEFDTTSPTTGLPHNPFANPTPLPKNPFSDPQSIRRRHTPHFSSNTAYQGVSTQDPDPEAENEKPKPPPWVHTPRNLEEWKPFILVLGILLGFVSYIAQWLFWSGFVNASDDRFCPPNTGVLGMVWVLAGVLGFGSVFGFSYPGAGG
ncbi:uncharacterized protein LY89DRAFT_785387 [Mollisia scopiformis]|uniref:Uncharacterized protein n=1 Tax=Mollisia scopiformis TaxID=149040 RepID=A0A194WY07_MOLSC|nr:uncharacterized protein LY89DRAFT_785387 [Mollisia scopiformis]KUJ12810.1 hypothetical protein LY89DRAFT_785387 [Mollisia scopiformis]